MSKAQANLLSDGYAMELTVSEWPISISNAAPVDMSRILFRSLSMMRRIDYLVGMRRR